MTNSFLALDFDPSVRELYDRFLVRCAHVLVAGLYRDGREYVIVVPELEAYTMNGRPLDEWFDGSFKPMTWPVSLRSAIPTGAEEMAARSRAELHRACGVVRTWAALERDLFLAVPSAIPLQGLREGDRTAVLQVSRELSEPELHALSDGFESLGSALPFQVEVVAGSDAVAPRRRPDRIELAISRHLAHSVPRAIREAVTRDEDVWRTQREIHDPVALSRHLDSQNPWKTEADKTCLVPTLFGTKNLRSYLSLYSQVIIDAPLADRTAEMFTSFGVERREFRELARRGVVRLIFPQSVERYDEAWLAELLEAAPDSVLMSRRLAAVTLQDQQRRDPLLAVAHTAFERRSVIRALRRAAEAVPQHAPLLLAKADALASHWEGAEYTLQERGALASLTGALGLLGSEYAKQVLKRDVALELMSAAQEVEWAGALGAHLVPSEGAGYSSEGAAQFLLALSTGAPAGTPSALVPPRHVDVAQDVLSFDNDTDVIDFVDALGQGDLARFRDLVPRLASGSLTNEEVDDLLAAWNAQANKYERKPERLKSYGITGIVMAAAAATAAGSPLATVLPWIVPFLPMLSTKIAEDGARGSALVGRVLDAGNGALAGTTSSAVLLSRMRKDVRTMKKLTPSRTRAGD